MPCAWEKTQVSSKYISPLSGVSNPASMRNSVVLPQPDGPNNVVNAPSASVSVMG